LQLFFYSYHLCFSSFFSSQNFISIKNNFCFTVSTFLIAWDFFCISFTFQSSLCYCSFSNRVEPQIHLWTTNPLSYPSSMFSQSLQSYIFAHVYYRDISNSQTLHWATTPQLHIFIILIATPLISFTHSRFLSSSTQCISILPRTSSTPSRSRNSVFPYWIFTPLSIKDVHHNPQASRIQLQ